MRRVYIVTDSSASIPPQTATRLDIGIVPILVYFGEQVFEDGIGLTTDEFYHRMQAGELPRTSSPTVGSFLKAYRNVPSDAAGILCVTVPSAVSGTFASAYAAARAFQSERPELEVVVMDVPVALGAQGLAVMDVAELAAVGRPMRELRNRLQWLCARARVFVTFDTILYLVRGGRVSALAGWLATALNVKPILEVREGRPEPVARVRTMRTAVDAIIRYAVEHARGSHECRCMILHAAAPDQAESLRQRLSDLLHPSYLVVRDISPVVGAHMGPGGIGAAILALDDPDDELTV